MNHSHIGRARLLSSRGGPYHLCFASYTRPDPGAPPVGYFQIMAFRSPRRLQQTTLKSIGSLSPLSPLWLDSCPQSGGLTTEDTKGSEKEGLWDGADVYRSKPQAIGTTAARRFRPCDIRPDPGAPRVGCRCIGAFSVGRARPRLKAARFADGPAGFQTCATSDGRQPAHPVHGLDAIPDFGVFPN